MTLLHATIFGITVWRIGAVLTLVGLYLGLRVYWRREEAQQRSAVTNNAVTQPNVPTLRNPAARKWKQKAPDLTDTQRIDHLHRNVSLKAGEDADLKELTFGRLTKLRVAFAGIEHSSGQEFAHIKVELGGATADCGKSVQELGDNDFLVPRALSNDQHASIHYTCGQKDAVSFLQVKVIQLDAAKQSASIDVLHVRGRRAA